MQTYGSCILGERYSGTENEGTMFFYKLWRLVKVVAHFAYAAIELTIKRPQSRPDRAAWLSTFCRRVLRAMDVSFATEGRVPVEGAVITNHLSYVDILVHSATRPCVFVSKIEVRKMPLLGWMSMMAGTVYVERGAGGSAQTAAVTMAKGFRDGLPVVFFPEGTTGVGDEEAMPFRSGLLAQALAADAPVTPGFLRYALDPRDAARGKTVRDDVAWGPQSFQGHIWNFMGLRRVQATVRFAESAIAFTAAAREDRKLAALEARNAVLAVAHPGTA